MKPKIKNYEIIVAFIIIANIMVFMYFSKRLESFIIKYSAETEARGDIE